MTNFSISINNHASCNNKLIQIISSLVSKHVAKHVKEVLPTFKHTVDGQNPAPPKKMIIPLFKGFWPSQVVQDSVHQQYETIMHTCTPESIWNLSQETPGYVRPWNLPRWGECRNGWSWNDEPPGSVEVRLTLKLNLWQLRCWALETVFPNQLT